MFQTKYLIAFYTKRFATTAHFRAKKRSTERVGLESLGFTGFEIIPKGMGEIKID